MRALFAVALILLALILLSLLLWAGLTWAGTSCTTDEEKTLNRLQTLYSNGTRAVGTNMAKTALTSVGSGADSWSCCTTSIANIRTGSHRVVVGQEHQFSRFGGLEIGIGHASSGAVAVARGGGGHTASEEGVSVSGRSGSTATPLTA